MILTVERQVLFKIDTHMIVCKRHLEAWKWKRRREREGQ